MGNLDFSANADQLKELAAYMASQINVPTIGIGGGYAPIGSINFFDATTAPQDWLACDGTVYNIADYPQLADWYEAQHGSKNFYGGNGTTTFAVPDLQGEFLRGTGTNSHTNQGSGANVGVHQDGTEHRTGGYYKNSIRVLNYPDNLPWMNINSDSDIPRSAGEYKASASSEGTYSEAKPSFTSRPTNTSFLICVKAVVAGFVYSTDERVVGTWIDGKPLYQKTWNDLDTDIILPTNAWVNAPHISINNVDIFIDCKITADQNVDAKKAHYIFNFNYGWDHTNNYLLIQNTRSTQNSLGVDGRLYSVTIQYTKTTD